MKNLMRNICKFLMIMISIICGLQIVAVILKGIGDFIMSNSWFIIIGLACVYGLVKIFKVDFKKFVR